MKKKITVERFEADPNKMVTISFCPKQALDIFGPYHERMLYWTLINQHDLSAIYMPRRDLNTWLSNLLGYTANAKLLDKVVIAM